MLDLSESTRHTIILSIALPSSFLSIIATSMVFMLYITIPQLHIFPFRIVFYFQTADFIMSCGQLLTAFLCQYGALSTIIWAIMITSLMAISMHKTTKAIEEYEKIIIFIGFHIPAFLSIIPFLVGGYGSSGVFCWIGLQQNQLQMILLMVLMFYMFLWFAMVYNSFVMLYLQRTISKLKGLKMVAADEFYHKIKYFPLIMIIWWIVPSIHKIYQFMFQDDMFILAAIHVFCESSYCLANTMLYALNPKVRAILKKKNKQMVSKKTARRN